MQKLKNIDDVALVLGGNTALGEALAINATNIANWKRQKWIPANQYLVISAMLKERGCEADIELFGFKKMLRK